MSDLTLNPQQAQAIRKTLDWYDTERFVRPFKFTGYAGTGKTTMVQKLLKEIRALKPVLVAPTGKAARVLSRKSGRLAGTIHSILYRPITDQISEMRKVLGDLVEEQILRQKGERRAVDPDFDGHIGDDQPYAFVSTANLDIEIESTRLRISEAEKTDVGFSKQDFSTLRQMYDLMVVDEASMVDENTAKDLIATGIPLLLVYDPFQLPPVKSRTPWSKDVDVELTQIMRQGEGSGIARAAEGIRKGKPLVPNDDVRLVKIKHFTQDHYDRLLNYDLVLAGTNATRRSLNRGMRRRLGRPDEPVIGDRVIALANTRKVRNGELFTIEDIEPIGNTVAEMLLRDDFGETHEVRCWLPLFKNDGNTSDVPFGITPLTYGNCITVHKAQGSEAEKVLLMDDWKGSDYARWLYTGVTRASKECVVVRSN